MHGAHHEFYGPSSDIFNEQYFGHFTFDRGKTEADVVRESYLWGENANES